MSHTLRPLFEEGSTHTFQIIDVKVLEKKPAPYNYTKALPGEVAHEVHGTEFLENVCDL